MLAYNPAARAFYNEAYNGGPYRVERRKHGSEPIDIPRLAVAVYGGTQPDKLAELTRGADDGLLARFQWCWPDPVEFRESQDTPDVQWAIEALDRLRLLELQPGDPPTPRLMPLVDEARRWLVEFAREMQFRRRNTSGLLSSAFGKARGTVLRLSCVLEWLWYSAGEGIFLDPPDTVSSDAVAAAAKLVGGYFMPHAERVYGDAEATEIDRLAATLARWILEERPPELHVRQLQRGHKRLPGLRTAEQIRKGADALVDADWLRPPLKGSAYQQRGRISYSINPKLFEV